MAGDDVFSWCPTGLPLTFEVKDFNRKIASRDTDGFGNCGISKLSLRM